MFSSTTTTKFPSCPSWRTWRARGAKAHWPLLSPYSWACGNLAGELSVRDVLAVRQRDRGRGVRTLGRTSRRTRRRSRSSTSRCWGWARTCSRAAGGCRRRWQSWSRWSPRSTAGRSAGGPRIGSARWRRTRGCRGAGGHSSGRCGMKTNRAVPACSGYCPYRSCTCC